MQGKKTIELDHLLNYIEDERELECYLQQHLSQETLNFIDYLEQLRLTKNLKKSTLIEQADIHRTYGYQILNGTKKPSRDNLLKLCFGGEFTLDEANRLLTLAGYNKLYSKDQRDSLLIFCLNKQFPLLKTNLFLDHYNQAPLGEED